MAIADLDWAGEADAQENALKQMDGTRGLRQPVAAPTEGITVAERSLLQKVIRKSLVDNKNDLEIQRKDPNCPLYSVKSFEALNLQPNLLKVSLICYSWHLSNSPLTGSLRHGLQRPQQDPGDCPAHPTS